MTVIPFPAAGVQPQTEGSRNMHNEPKEVASNMRNLATPSKNTSPWTSNKLLFQMLVGRGKTEKLRVSSVTKGSYFGLLVQSWYPRNGKLNPGGGLALFEDEWKALVRRFAKHWGWSIDESPTALHDSHGLHDLHVLHIESESSQRRLEGHEGGEDFEL